MLKRGMTMGRPKSEFVSACGTLFEIVKAEAEEVYALGGTDDDIRRILVDKELRRARAELLVRNGGTEMYELPVDYDAFRTIRRDRYAFVGDVTISDYPETETGTKPVKFRELEFDHDPTDQEVLDEAKRRNCRQPSRAEAETAICRYTPEQLREHPRVGLIGPAVRRVGDLRRACVSGGGDGVRLGWDWAERRWARRCRFVVVCK